MLVAAVVVLAGCTQDEPDPGSGPPAAGSPSTQTRAGEPGLDASSRIPEIVEQVEPSIVTIDTGDGQGSGVVYESGGTIVTNAHVVGEATEVAVTLASGEELPGQVIATDTVTDLAVVEVGRDLPALEFEDGLPQVGELVLAMGSPLGFESSVTAGIVSGLGRNLPGAAGQSRALVDLIQTDAAISPGNSGGGLVNAEGNVVGINEAYIPPGAGAVSIGFAIPASTVVDTVDELLEDGAASHPYLGIVPARITPRIAEELDVDVESGVLVVQAAQGGPAARAGLRPGDVITAFNGTDVESIEEFLGELAGLDPGDTVEMTVVRAGQERTVTMELGRLQP